jgi:hypothetical protein
MRPCSVLKCKEYDSAQYGMRLRRVKHKCASIILPNIIYTVSEGVSFPKSRFVALQVK